MFKQRIFSSCLFVVGSKAYGPRALSVFESFEICWDFLFGPEMVIFSQIFYMCLKKYCVFCSFYVPLHQASIFHIFIDFVFLIRQPQRKGMLKPPTLMMVLSVFPRSSLGFCFIYSGTILLEHASWELYILLVSWNFSKIIM